MDLRYIMYVTEGKKYYYPPKQRAKKSSYSKPELADGWYTEIDEHNHWRYYIRVNNTLPDQGWKIHVSSPLYAAQQILDLIAPILVERGVEFKYVDNEWELFLKNSKYGDRGGSGKFITIYPKEVNEFEELINVMEPILEGTPPGPYILSDKCWKETNIYFRYGGIRPIYADVGGSNVLAIKNINGEYMEDTRGPSYSLPDFIEEPEFIKKMDQELQLTESQGKSNLEEFEIEKALHFSNGGGVYLAKRKEDEVKVILKEGRPESGIDGDYKDAYSRIYKEAEMLDKLRDVPDVADYYGIFREWKHIFLQEEYVEGVALNTWTALHYPFYSQSNLLEEYSNNACKILGNSVNALKAIHNYNVGMGDLQPMNIMVNNDDYSVKLIDFEAADDLKNPSLPALITPGFATAKAKNRREGDWFGLTRIARHTFLPIGPIQDIDERIIYKHDLWIKKHFGKECFDVIQEIQAESDKYLPAKKYDKIDSFYENFFTEEELPSLINMIRQGMVSDLECDEILLGGDIRQFEETSGKVNVKTGGFGIVYSLLKTGALPDIAKQWIEKYSDAKYIDNLNDGLYSGKAGIACVLYMLGNKEKAIEIFSKIEISKDNKDVSILTGLAGIGLALISLERIDRNKELGEKIDTISEYIEILVDEDITLTVSDPDGVAIGLFCGWAGVALYFLLLYRIRKEAKWLDLSIKILEKDIKKCIFDDNGVYHVDDNKRFFPYLDGGSIGIGMVLIEIKKHLNYEYMEKELEGLKKQNYSRCCHNVSLFHGIAGFIAFANHYALSKNEPFSNYRGLLESLNLYLIEDEGKVYCPGNYSYKLSGDLFSGSAGVMLTLLDLVNKRNFTWLPLIEVEKLFV